MQRSTITALAVFTTFTMVGMLSGCVETPPTEPEAQAPVVVALPGLSPSERLRRGLEMLEDGDEATARAELVAYVRASNNSRTGRSLLRQIDMSPQEYFPTEFREVILRKDQSLSNIAKTYLGSALQFHALAKYNGIKQPKRMFPGQIVKVPLTEAATNAFNELEDALDEPSLDSQPLVESLNSEAQELLDADDLQSAEESIPEDQVVDTLSEVASQADTPTNAAQADSEAGMPSQSADLPVAIITEIEEEPVSAPEEAHTAAEAMPPQAETSEPAVSVDVDGLHRQAINAYRAQDLDTAISIWNQVLQVDPSYEGARLYRSQALVLRKRLNSFN